MAIIYEDKKILLTEELAKRFVNKLKSKNLEASKKRDIFLKQAKSELKVKNVNNITVITTKR
ncbi:hypothetical protein [Romboutsia sp.]|uniref:hypothetical protein n=1 Tax=Romboutsia sp. TaxID=1965302 RepID=UPI003F2A39D7